jgi:hypothetical protein
MLETKAWIEGGARYSKRRAESSEMTSGTKAGMWQNSAFVAQLAKQAETLGLCTREQDGAGCRLTTFVCRSVRCSGTANQTPGVFALPELQRNPGTSRRQPSSATATIGRRPARVRGVLFFTWAQDESASISGGQRIKSVSAPKAPFLR